MYSGRHFSIFGTLVFLIFLGFTTEVLSNSLDKSELFDKIKKIAESGNVEAQYHLGMFYNNGIGHSKDQNEAFKWFHKSADKGDPLAAFKLGCYYGGQASSSVIVTDEKKSLKYNIISAKAGYSLAQQEVALYFFSKSNGKEAIKYAKMAADQGDAHSLYLLSKIYAEGKLTKKNQSLAYAYFKLSKLLSETQINPVAKKSLSQLASQMSEQDLNYANEFVLSFVPKPTKLTLQAENGLERARKLVEGDSSISTSKGH